MSENINRHNIRKFSGGDHKRIPYYIKVPSRISVPPLPITFLNGRDTSKLSASI